MASTVSNEDEATPSPRLPALEQPYRSFSVVDIQSATCNFDKQRCIGRGGFGEVFKGMFMDGLIDYTYAIKRLNSMSDQGEPEFWVEVEMLSRLRHCNLVSLIGYCNDRKEMALVYEYMQNGSLSDHLHKKGTPLTWSQRLKICIGAARGLDYLHTGTGTLHGVIHRDVKSSNILLDENYAAKISDFGLAIIGPTNQTHTYVRTKVKGTFGYMDPNYVYTGILTRKSDVYAFGVVLLEVLCGKPAVDTSMNEALAAWAQERIKQGKLIQIVHSSLRDHISRTSLKEFCRIAARCLLSQPNQRPTMSEVISSLDLALISQIRKDSSAREGVIIKKVWSFLTVKGHFEVKNSGSTHTPESSERHGREDISESVSTPGSEEVIQRESPEGQDANDDQVPSKHNLEITNDEVITDIVSTPVTMVATKVKVDKRRPLRGQDANYDRMSMVFNLEVCSIKFSMKLLAFRFPRLRLKWKQAK